MLDTMLAESFVLRLEAIARATLGTTNANEGFVRFDPSVPIKFKDVAAARGLPRYGGKRGHSSWEDEFTNRRNDRRVLGFCQSMSERQKVTTAKLLAIIESEFAQLFGRSVRDYMPCVRLHACAGEPNWNAEISGDVGISVLGPFLVALGCLKSQYDLDDDDRERLIAKR